MQFPCLPTSWSPRKGDSGDGPRRWHLVPGPDLLLGAVAGLIMPPVIHPSGSIVPPIIHPRDCILFVANCRSFLQKRCRWLCTSRWKFLASKWRRRWAIMHGSREKRRRPVKVGDGVEGCVVGNGKGEQSWLEGECYSVARCAICWRSKSGSWLQSCRKV